MRSRDYLDSLLEDSTTKEKKLATVYERLQGQLHARLDLTLHSSELPPADRLRVIENLLRGGVGRSVLAETPLLQDGGVSRPITTCQPAESKNKRYFSFLPSNEAVLRANLQTWFSPKRKLRWLKLPKTRAR